LRRVREELYDGLGLVGFAREMASRVRFKDRVSAKRLGLAVASPTVVTILYLVLFFSGHQTALGFLYLIAVLAIASGFGLWEGLVASVVAALEYALVLPPVSSLRISAASDLEALGAFIITAVVAVVTSSIRRRQLERSEHNLRQLSGQLLRTQDEERRRIGRDLHDSVSQYLSVLKIKLSSLKSWPRPNDKVNVNQDVEQCIDLAEQAIKEVRVISYLLHPPLLEEMGLRSAISWYVSGFTERSGIKTTLDIAPDLGRLPRHIEIAMFRVLQESLTNVHRHSGSLTANVRLGIKDNAVILGVLDQGKGIPLGTMKQRDREEVGVLGVGLLGMSERLRQLGGKLELTSSSQGTTVTAIVPIEESPQQRHRLDAPGL
jgi:signal transduction histidine kinase